MGSQTSSVHSSLLNTHLLLSTIFGNRRARFRYLIGLFVSIIFQLNVRTLSAKEIYASCMFQPTKEFLISPSKFASEVKETTRITKYED